jgi:hypothetical protein
MNKNNMKMFQMSKENVMSVKEFLKEFLVFLVIMTSAWIVFVRLFLIIKIRIMI